MTRVQSIARKVLAALEDWNAQWYVFASSTKTEKRVTVRELRELAIALDGRPIEVKAKQKREIAKAIANEHRAINRFLDSIALPTRKSPKRKPARKGKR